MNQNPKQQILSSRQNTLNQILDQWVQGFITARFQEKIKEISSDLVKVEDVSEDDEEDTFNKIIESNIKAKEKEHETLIMFC